MVEYLVGMKDYHKIVHYDKKCMTLIYTSNIHNTLSRPSKTTVPTMPVPVVQLPKELIALRFRTNSVTTVEMYMDNGWQIGFRLHNASSKVEPSLKFDVAFIGMPCSILCIECRWEKI